MTFILVCRNPSNQHLLIITEGDAADEPAEFVDRDAAVQAADNTPVCKAWGYQVIEVE